MEGTITLQKNERNRLYAKWISRFCLHGKIDHIHQKIIDHASYTGEEAISRFQRFGKEGGYLIYRYDRTNATVEFTSEFKIEEISSSRTDIALVSANFENCLVYNHEDNTLSSGPIYLKAGNY